MSNLKKILCITLVLLAVVSLGACTDTPKSMNVQWSYKTASEEYLPGIYIFSLFTAYDNAYGILSDSLGDKFDENASIMDIESTFDETDQVYVCRDWIKKEADIISRNLIAMDIELEKHGIKLDPQAVESAREEAKKDWYVGPYYFDYGPEYSTSYRSILEQYGVSFDSYFQSSVNLANVKQDALFDYLYAKGGEKEVSDKEVKKYFNENYTSYSYFTVPMFTTTQDESGATVQVPLTEEEFNKTQSVLKSYENLIKEGASFSSVANTYAEYAKLTSDPTISGVEDLDNNSTLPDEVVEKLKEMKDNTCAVTYTATGETDTPVAYFLYKKPLKDSAKEYLADEVNYKHLLMEMKGEEFYDYLSSLADTIECEVNVKYIDKCDPEMFEEIRQ